MEMEMEMGITWVALGWQMLRHLGCLLAKNSPSLSKTDIRIQADPVQAVSRIPVEDAVAQLMKYINQPHINKPSGQALSGLFDKIFEDRENIA